MKGNGKADRTVISGMAASSMDMRFIVKKLTISLIAF